MRYAFWLLFGLDLVLLLPGVYMASNAIGLAGTAQGSFVPLGIAALFIMLPVFCILAPLSGWGAIQRGNEDHAVLVVMAPVVYAIFLTAFMFSS